MIRIIAAVAAAAILSGCSTLSVEEPTNGPRARVRFTTNTESIMVVRGYDDAGCESGEKEWMRLANHFLVNSDPKRLDMPLWSFHPNAAKELYVTTAPHTFLFSGSGGTHLCGVAVHQTFEQDRDYELSFNVDSASCNVQLNVLESVNGTPVRTFLKEYSNKVTPTTQGCLRQFNAPRHY